MTHHYIPEEKQTLIQRHLEGESISAILKETQIPRSTFYAWTKKYSDEQQLDKQPKINLWTFHHLTQRVERLEGIVQILKTVNCTANAPLDIKLKALEELYGQYNVHMLCDALDVARGTFYNHILRNKKDNSSYAKRREELRIKIQEVHDDNHQIFGAAKIAAVLKNQGERVSVEMVRELMRDMGLISIRQDAKDLYDKEVRKFNNHLKQSFDIDCPNQVWVSDVTYFKYGNKPIYICVIIDLFARRVVGYTVGLRSSTYLVKAALKQAYENRKPSGELLFHTDRGSNYRSKAFSDCVKALNIKHSFSRTHVPYDNSVAESFFANLKREELYRRRYRSERELKKGIDDYMVFYDEKRPHAKLKYKTPQQMEQDHADKHTGSGMLGIG